MLLMMVVIFGIMWFFMIRPQQKKQKEIRKFRESLTKGSNVVTAGGIYGKIKEIDDNNPYVLLSIADGVTIKIDKGSIYPSAADAAATGNDAKEKA